MGANLRFTISEFYQLDPFIIKTDSKLLKTEDAKQLDIFYHKTILVSCKKGVSDIPMTRSMRRILRV